MCIPEKDTCPINDVIDEETYNKIKNPEKYIKAGNLYYSNEITDKSIIAKLSYNSSNDIIHKSNLIFDYGTYKSLVPEDKVHDIYYMVFDNNVDYAPVKYDGYSEEDSFSDGERHKAKERKLTSKNKVNSEYIEYIKQRINDDINKDKSYRKLYNNTYGGNYLGFKDYSTLEKFTSLDLYNLYFILFPNKVAYIFSYFLAVIYTAMVIYSVIRLIKEDGETIFENFCYALTEQVLLFLPYLFLFWGFFLYIVYEYVNIYVKLGHEELLEIKADPFFEDLLKEIYDRNPKPYLIILFIALYSLSLIIYILAWILNHCFGKIIKYFESY